MKKAMVWAVAVMVAATAMGQEGRPWSFGVEAGLGITRFINQPALSLAADATPQYSALTPTLMAGFGNGRNTFGLRYGLTSVNTSATALREVANVHEVSLLWRRAVEVAPRVELFGGVSIGMVVVDNELDLNGRRRSVYRYGLAVGAEVGLRYRLSETIAAYISVGVGRSNLFGGSVDLPADYARQVHGSAATVSSSGGISIGLAPRKRTLNMPDALVRNSEPLQLACYWK